LENREAFPVSVYLNLTNDVPTANQAAYANFLGDNKTRVSQLGPLTGNSSKSLAISFNIADFVGVSDPSIIDPFSALTTPVDPTELIYLIPGVISVSNLVSGVDVQVDAWYDIEFFERKTLVSDV